MLRFALLALAIGGSLFAGVLPPYNVSNGSAPFTVDYNGIGGTPPAVIPVLSAQVTYSNFVFSTVSGKTQVQFDYSVYNNSAITSNVTGIGFATTPDVIASTSSVTGAFTQVHDGSPGFPIPTVTGALEFCFNNNNASCAGSGGGVAQGVTSGGTATLKFSSLFSTLTFDNFFVRYQGFNYCFTTTNCTGSGVGVATAVPEPRLILFLSAGVIGVLATRFRRRPAA